jgi:Protein of unknown function (DUF3179)
MRPTRSWFVVALVATSATLLAQSEQLQVVLPRDAIPSIDKPAFEAASTTHSLDKREPVIGIVGEHEQRAYSTWQLDRHEIVNDTFEGRPIAVTW